MIEEYWIYGIVIIVSFMIIMVLIKKDKLNVVLSIFPLLISILALLKMNNKSKADQEKIKELEEEIDINNELINKKHTQLNETKDLFDTYLMEESNRVEKKNLEKTKKIQEMNQKIHKMDDYIEKLKSNSIKEEQEITRLNKEIDETIEETKKELMELREGDDIDSDEAEKILNSFLND